MPNWIDKKSEAHLEATEWFSFCQEGFPDAVIFANDGSVLDGTYKQMRYIQEQRYQQLEQVAREMWHYVVAHNTPNVPGVDMSGFEEQLEELGVKL